MKKQFVKPEIQRISLNFQENIVASEKPKTGQVGGWIMLSQDSATCKIQTTDWIYTVMAPDINKVTYAHSVGCMLMDISLAQMAMTLGLEL